MDEFALIERYFRRPDHPPGDGVVLGPGDDAALEKAIVSLLQDPAGAAAMGSTV